ncbi:uncharacterized protein [Nicotiana sylvestris]|uniref:uncharacterized protein n=1 Tax=Nicotiana sylvestris TaxID=4096 RepID=UPI00388C70B4
MTVTCNETTQQTDIDSEEDDIPDDIVKEVENFEKRPKSNRDEAEIVNLGDVENVKEMQINIHLSPLKKKEYTEFLKEYEDIFAWSYDDMTGLSRSIVAHKLPIDPMCPPEIEVYVDDVIIKSKKATKHIEDLRRFFNTLWRYYLKLKPAKCAFGVPAGKFLGFIVSRQRIELDPSKVKAIQELPPPKNKKDVMSFLGRLNYISQFIAQSTVIGEPIFRMLKNDASTKWTDDCQKAFDRIKEYLSTPSVLVPHEPGRPLLLYLAVLDGAFGYILGKHDETRRKEQVIIISIRREDIAESYDSWRMFFDGAANFKGVSIGAVLISETGQHYPMSAKLRFPCTNNMAKYEACILGLKMAIDMNIEELLIHADMIKVPPSELNTTSSPWSFAVWGMDIIGRFEPAASNRHSDLMKAMCENFKIRHKNSTAYRPQMNGVVEAANKNIKKILRKMIEKHKQWHEKLSFALIGYHTIVCTSIGETPYMLVYGTEAFIPVEVSRRAMAIPAGLIPLQFPQPYQT